MALRMPCGTSWLPVGSCFPHAAATVYPTRNVLRRAWRCGMNMVLLAKRGAVKAFFPFHDDKRRRELFSVWVRPYSNPGKQPLDLIKVSFSTAAWEFTFRKGLSNGFQADRSSHGTLEPSFGGRMLVRRGSRHSESGSARSEVALADKSGGSSPAESTFFFFFFCSCPKIVRA